VVMASTGWCTAYSSGDGVRAEMQACMRGGGRWQRVHASAQAGRMMGWGLTCMVLDSSSHRTVRPSAARVMPQTCFAFDLIACSTDARPRMLPMTMCAGLASGCDISSVLTAAATAVRGLLPPDDTLLMNHDLGRVVSALLWAVSKALWLLMGSPGVPRAFDRNASCLASWLQ
jgi:hypothetical protein